MHIETSDTYRYVIGTLGESWVVDVAEGRSRGKLDIIIEEFRSEKNEKEYSLINEREYFCETEKVFITGYFDELEKNYNSNQLLIAKVRPANKAEGNQQNYIAYYKDVVPVKNVDLLEVLDSGDVFNPDDPVIYSGCMPSTKMVMLSVNQDGESFIQGPFSYEAIGQMEEGYKITLKYPSTPFPGKSAGSYLIGSLEIDKCQDQILTVGFDNRSVSFLSSMLTYMDRLAAKDYFDIIDSETLLRNYVEPLLKDAVFRTSGGKITKKGIEVLRNNIKKGRQFKKDRIRYFRTVEMLSKVVDYDVHMTKLKDELLSRSEGQDFLENYLKRNELEFYNKYRADRLEKIKQEESDKRLEIDRLEEKRNNLVKELKNIAQQKSEKETELLQMEENKRAELEEQILHEQKKRHAELQSEIAAQEDFLIDIKSKYSEYENYQDLLDAIEKKRNEFGAIESLIQGSKDSLANLNAQIQESSAKLTEQFVNIKAGFEAMTRSNNTSVTKWDFSSLAVRRLDVDNRVKAQQEHIDLLDEALCSYDRSLERELLVNLVTTIAQSQFTICAGLPGTGKTSLIKRLGQAMNLGYRQHTISISRGWMSSNDVLGYYNGLSRTYQPAATGLWELLLTMQHENPEEVTPSILLLDEMNLSSPEHYFSSFLDLADEESKREIFTGFPDQERIVVPEYLRFVGTINSDETVQPLSPRMLDRSAVIPFDDMVGYVARANDSSKPMEPISASDWLCLFKGQGKSLSGDSQSIFNEVLYILEDDNEEFGKRILISYRKRRLIADFVNVAGALLVEREGAVTALDRAILQHVIPCINGYGSGFAGRLNRLLQVFKKYGLDMSVKYLNKIIVEGGRELNSYRYMS